MFLALLPYALLSNMFTSDPDWNGGLSVLLAVRRRSHKNATTDVYLTSSPYMKKIQHTTSHLNHSSGSNHGVYLGRKTVIIRPRQRGQVLCGSDECN
jgi:hypothetical protein